jgi:tetratricopeptide (TPR) repeat protein
MLNGKLRWLLLACSLLCIIARGQEMTLQPGNPVEREIAGGQSHTYPIKLSAGQFMRVAAVQKEINIVVALADAEGKEIWEANFSNNFGGRESLSYEAATPGEYQVIVRPFSNTAQKGTYELGLEVKAAATAEDRKRIQAERLFMEGLNSLRQSNFQSSIEKALEVLPLWRALGDAYWEADTLSLLGSAHNSTRKFDQAAEFYNQALLLRRQIKDRAGESNTLYDLGVVAGGQNKNDQFLGYLTQALEIKRELKDRAGEARTLTMWHCCIAI